MNNGVITLTASGHRCPKSGHYESQTVPPIFIDMSEGQSVPLCHGRIAYWKLVVKNQPSKQ